ncbi:hypothetical protein BC830DRAFT_1123974 [Chytriomyces sp. MP71]|nr:hypothetical protein BC830DRAFT_1123974 [Chytriomyces sp. MP71]
MNSHSRTAAKNYSAFMAWPYVDPLDWKPPGHWFTALLSPITWLFPVKVVGQENLPSDATKILYVGNHTNWALDISLFFPAVNKLTKNRIRTITDRAHSKIPIFFQLIKFIGGVVGTRENVDRLMGSGTSPVLIYPGGAEEVWKDARIKPYTLLWADRAGFARFAAKYGYTIVPFASVGLEDSFDIWFSIPARWLFALVGDSRGGLVKSKKDDATAKPFSKGYVPPQVADCRIPVYKPWFLRPQTQYIVLGKPIDASNVDADNEEAVFELRDSAREGTQECINNALVIQAGDPDRFTDVRALFGLGQSSYVVLKRKKEE